MKILFCNYEYPPLGGGGGVINALLAEELAKRHEITVLTSQGLGLPREEAINNVRVIRAPVFFRRQKAAANIPSMLAYLPMGIRAGKKLLDRETFDIINTHFALPSGPVGDALSRLGRIPNVLSVHGGDLYDPSKFASPHRHAILRHWIRKLLRRANAVVGQSRNTLSNMQKYYTPEIEGIRIPLGINRPNVIITSRGEFGFSGDEFLFVTVGRLVARKAVDQLIGIMGHFKGKPVRLLIIGSGPQEQILREKASQLHITNQVQFMGHVSDEDKQKILKVSDAFISTSQHEGFGIVYLEAMSAGLPVICYNYGGQTDFLEDGKTGSVLSLNDTEAVFEACNTLINNKGYTQRLSEENMRRIESLYIDSCAKHYEEVFENLINKFKSGAMRDAQCEF